MRGRGHDAPRSYEEGVDERHGRGSFSWVAQGLCEGVAGGVAAGCSDKDTPARPCKAMGARVNHS